MKRSRTHNEKQVSSDINSNFLQECKEEFYDNPTNVMSRNAVVAI